jgi:hypothetical protein
VSYGLYLWHWPVIVWLTPERTGLTGEALLATRVVVSFAVTVVSYRFVERPLRRAGGSTGRHVAASISLVVTSLVVISVVVISLVVTSTPLDTSERRPDAGTRSTVPIPVPVESADVTTAADVGPTVTTRRVIRLLVVGDSGAYFLGESLRAAVDADGGVAGDDADVGVAGDDDVVVVPRGEIGCGIVNVGGGASTDVGFLPDPPDCDRWPERWAADVDAFAPTDVLVVLSWPGIGDRELDGELRHPCDPVFDAHHRERFRLAVATAGAGGADVWLANSPDLATAPPGDVSEQRIACINDSIRRTVDTATTDGLVTGRVRVLDLRGWVCPSGVCSAEIDGDVLRPDGLHFEGPGGLRAAEWILGRLT